MGRQYKCSRHRLEGGMMVCRLMCFFYGHSFVPCLQIPFSDWPNLPNAILNERDRVCTKCWQIKYWSGKT